MVAPAFLATPLRAAAALAWRSSGPPSTPALRGVHGRAVVADGVVRTPLLAPLPTASFAAYILGHVERHVLAAPNKVAIIDAGTTSPSPDLTFADVHSRVAAAARGLRALGVGRGSVVALHLPNSPEFAVAYVAIAALGGVITASNTAYTPAELAYQLTDSKAEILITVSALAATAAAAAATAGLAARAVLVLGDPAASFLLADATRARQEVPLEDVGDTREALLALPYSSGTTGLPKGVRLSHANIVSNVEQCCGSLPFDETDVCMSILPFYHIYGMTTVMAAGLRLGATICSLPKFEPMPFLAAAQRHKCTYMPLVPPVIAFLAKHPAVLNFDLRSVRAIFSGAAPLDSETQIAIEKRLPGATCRQGYGLTETSPVTHVFSSLRPIKPGSVGPPLQGTECRIVDVSTAEALAAAGSLQPQLLPAGAANVGELQVRGPQVMMGYHRNSQATSATLLSDGWLRTGDLAYFDEEGDFFVVDRLKELIKVKGMQVAPAELEGVLLAHPLIYDAAVVSVLDVRSGELPVAFVVTQATLLRAMGKTAEAAKLPVLSAEAVMAFVDGKVAAYKRVVAVSFVDAIPKSAAGKILRRVLRDRVRAEAAAVK